MSTRVTFGNIKSLLHFDFPYWASASVYEPNYGLKDEIVNTGGATTAWTRFHSVVGGGYNPDLQWLGRGCASFNTSEDTIFGTNFGPIYDFNPQSSYEIEFWMRPTAADNANVFRLENFGSTQLVLRMDTTNKLSVTCSNVWDNLVIQGDTPLVLDQWAHIMLRIHNNDMTLFVDGVEEQTEAIPNQNILRNTGIYLGGYAGMMDEYCFRHEMRTNFAPPITQYAGSVNVSELYGYGDGKHGNYTVSAQTMLNSYATVLDFQNNGQYVTLSPKRIGGVDAPTTRNIGSFGDFEVGDEVMIHISSPKLELTDEHIFKYSIRKIVDVQEDVIILDRELDFPANATTLAQYRIQAVKIPCFNNLTINAMVTCPVLYNNIPSGGTMGGIFAFKCAGTLDMQANARFNLFAPAVPSGTPRKDSHYFSHSDLLDRAVITSTAFIFMAANTVTALSTARIGMNSVNTGDQQSGPGTKNNELGPNVNHTWGYGGGSIVPGAAMSGYIVAGGAGAGAVFNAINTLRPDAAPLQNPGSARVINDQPGPCLVLLSDNLLGLPMEVVSTGSTGRSASASNVSGVKAFGGTGGCYIASNNLPLVLFATTAPSYVPGKPFNTTVPIRYSVNRINNQAHVDLRGSIIQSKAQAFDLLAKTYIDSLYMMGYEPSTSIRRIMFQTSEDDIIWSDWSIFDLNTKDLVPVVLDGPEPTTDEILIEGNLVSDIAVFKDIQEFVGKKVRIAAAMSLTDPNNPSPTLKIGILAV